MSSLKGWVIFFWSLWLLRRNNHLFFSFCPLVVDQNKPPYLTSHQNVARNESSKTRCLISLKETLSKEWTQWNLGTQTVWDNVKVSSIVRRKERVGGGGYPPKSNRRLSTSSLSEYPHTEFIIKLRRKYLKIDDNKKRWVDFFMFYLTLDVDHK